MKFPFIKFFPTDWLAEPALRACSVGARGLWMDMLSLMHLAPRRGYLLAATGLPISPEQLARMTGCSADEVVRLLGELQTSGAFSCTDDGMIYSRRMVREETKRDKCAEAGRRGGGNPTFKGGSKGGSKGGFKGEPKPPEARFQKPDSDPDPSEESEEETFPVVGSAGSAGSVGKPPRPDDVIAVWNATPGLPLFKGTNPNFRRMISERWRDQRFRDRWKDAIVALSRSDWHTGKAGGPDAFVATLSWVLDGRGWEKAFAVLERHDAKPAPPPERSGRNPMLDCGPLDGMTAQDIRARMSAHRGGAAHGV